MRSAEHISRQLKLRHLKVFLAVVQWGSMVRAAEHLSISQSVVSKAVSDLEGILGLPLLDRYPHGVELTLYGRALLNRGNAVFNDLRASVSELQFLADPTAGDLRIGSSEPIAAGLVCAVMDELSRRHRRLAFHVTVGEGPALCDRELRDRDIDLMIGRLPDADTLPHAEVEVLFQEWMFVVAGSRNPWTRRRRIELADLIDEPWCLPPPEGFPGSLVAKVFRARGLEVPRTGVAALSVQVQTRLLATGRFLTMLPFSILRFSAKQLSLKSLDVDLPIQPWPVGIVTLKNRTLNPAAQVFIDCARKTAELLANGHQV
jgi:DNA-binding transcriptional LysR family regulator